MTRVKQLFKAIMYQTHNLGEQNGTEETAIAYDFCNYSFLVDEISISFLSSNEEPNYFDL